MPRLDERDIVDWLNQEQNDQTDLSRPAFGTGEHDKGVALAIEALGTELDEAYKRDPASFGRHMRQDTVRIALQRLLGVLGSARVLRILSWMERAAPEAITPIDPTALERVRKEARRILFERLVAPARLKTLLDACDASAEAMP